MTTALLALGVAALVIGFWLAVGVGLQKLWEVVSGAKPERGDPVKLHIVRASVTPITREQDDALKRYDLYADILDPNEPEQREWARRGRTANNPDGL